MEIHSYGRVTSNEQYKARSPLKRLVALILINVPHINLIDHMSGHLCLPSNQVNSVSTHLKIMVQC